MGIVEGKGNTERLTYKTNGKYMNTVVEQAPPYAIDCDIDTAITKLAEYENLEEQKKLLTLPCAVGDTVYVLEKSQTGKYMVFCTTADSFSCAMWMLDGKFGKCIFPAYGEAEAALKELEKGKGE